MKQSPRAAKIAATKSKIWNKKFNLGRISEKFLNFLAEAIDGGYILAREFNDMRGTFISAWDDFEEEREFFRQQINKKRLLYELKRRRLVREEKTGNKIFYFLTEKGVAALARHKIFDCKKPLPKGRVCVIIFDIPESQKHIRELLRRFLKEAGFKYLQQSVWITQRDILENMKIFIKNIQAERWINLFVADAVIAKESQSKRLKLKN